MSEPKDLTELSESEIVALTLEQGIRVNPKGFEQVYPGFVGGIKAPFNEATNGNPVHSTTCTPGESMFTLAGTIVSVFNPVPGCTSVFSTPDGVVALTTYGRFWAYCAVEIPFTDCTDVYHQIDRENHRAQQELLPQLLNNIYRAVFAPDTVPAHWKAKGGEQQ